MILLHDGMMSERGVHSLGSKGHTIRSNSQGYGFRLSPKADILAVTLLILHAVIVFFGSVWQLFCGRCLMAAWNTVP